MLNTLLNEDRAIVSSIAGTTRDTIEDQININGVNCRFIDTAGIRNTDDEIESIGIERTFKKMNESEIIIFLIDYSTLNKEKLNYYVNYLSEIDNKFPNTKLITLLNKIDIKSEISVSDLDGFSPILISAKNKSNIDNLRDEILSYVNNLTSQIDNSTISNSRHYDLLNKTYEEIHKVKNSISKNISSDLLAIDIKQAIYFLGELTGEISNDEVLGNIFSKFCIGK